MGERPSSKRHGATPPVPTPPLVVRAEACLEEHHARWENVFHTVTVRFSTWDIGHKLSDRDHLAARNIEERYEDDLRELASGTRYSLISKR
jgi:hypothetical protein